MSKSLVECFAQVQDPRKACGKIYDLVPILCLTVVATLAGRNTLQGIAQFGRDHGAPLAHALGFRRASTPSASTLSRLFRKIDVEAFEAIIHQWVIQRCPELGEQFCMDGKTLRASKDGEVPNVHLLSLYAPHVQAVIGQMRVDSKTNEHKASLKLLGIIPIEGKIITGDAMFCQTEVAQAVIDEEADYILHVKDNQPTVKEKIAELLDATASFSPYSVA